MNDVPRDPGDAPDVSVPPTPSTVAPKAAPAGQPLPEDQLTPEEQMARFEQELKETDWGHQPC